MRILMSMNGKSKSIHYFWDVLTEEYWKLYCDQQAFKAYWTHIEEHDLPESIQPRRDVGETNKTPKRFAQAASILEETRSEVNMRNQSHNNEDKDGDK